MQQPTSHPNAPAETGLSGAAAPGARARGEAERGIENRPYAGTDPRPDTSEVPRPAD